MKKGEASGDEKKKKKKKKKMKEMRDEASKEKGRSIFFEFLLSFFFSLSPLPPRERKPTDRDRKNRARNNTKQTNNKQQHKQQNKRAQIICRCFVVWTLLSTPVGWFKRGNKDQIQAQTTISDRTTKHIRQRKLNHSPIKNRYRVRDWTAMG